MSIDSKEWEYDRQKQRPHPLAATTFPVRSDAHHNARLTFHTSTMCSKNGSVVFRPRAAAG